MRSISLNASFGAAVLCIVMTVSQAQELNRTLTVKELLRVCGDETRQLICSSFIAGVVNTADYFNSKRRIERGFKKGDGFCIFAKAPSQQEIEANVLVSLRKKQNIKMDNVIVGDIPASIGIYFAMIEIYPCNENDPF